MLYPQFTWKRTVANPVLYLTFDDGPIPEITPWVLDTLKHANIKATFFCIGDNIRKHPDVFQRIIAEGHQVGNHTYHHLNGWKTSLNDYIENTAKCAAIIEASTLQRPKLFRPPYGKITRRQAKELQQQGYEIIMWHNLTKDYDPKVTPKQCLFNSSKNLKKGNIIVFHDSLKAEKNLKYALPQLIRTAQEQGYTFETL